MTGLLDGLRVVEGSAFVAVPLAGMTLAQMGADVIRFDRLEGGLDARRWPVTPSGHSLFWAGLNKGKRSIAVDFSTPRGKEIVAELICAPGRDGGCFLTNLRANGTLDYQALAPRRRDLIMVSLTGDRHGRPAVDYTVNAAVGFPMATGPEGSREPVAHILPAWDCIAGTLVATGFLAAERHRLRTGAGQLLEVSLKDVAAAALGHLGIIGEVAINGVDRPKAGNAIYGAYGQDFVCADGRRIMIVAITARQWQGLVRLTGTAKTMAALGARLGLDLAEEGARFLARHEITSVLRPWFGLQQVATLGPLLDEAGITWSEFRSFAQAVREDPDLSPENPMFRLVDQPGIGAYPVPGLPFVSSAVARAAPTPAPTLGEHTEEILAAVLGLGGGQIAALFDAGVVAGPRPLARA